MYRVLLTAALAAGVLLYGAYHMGRASVDSLREDYLRRLAEFEQRKPPAEPPDCPVQAEPDVDAVCGPMARENRRLRLAFGDMESTVQDLTQDNIALQARVTRLTQQARAPRACERVGGPFELDLDQTRQLLDNSLLGVTVVNNISKYVRIQINGQRRTLNIGSIAPFVDGRKECRIALLAITSNVRGRFSLTCCQ